MRKTFYTLCVLIIALTSCKDDDINAFEKSADERVAEAIAALKQDLIAPANGWKINYRPEESTGSFHVLLKFDEDNNVTIQTDLSENNGEYFQQTIKYRIDNSLGLELIFENYSFFSFLFEQDEANLGAEYEFNFVNKTPDDALVFSSKSDIGNPTILLFEEASQADANLLGQKLSGDLRKLSEDLDKFTSSLKLTYSNKDLVLYLSLDELHRTIRISSASLSTDINTTQSLNFITPYLLQGNRMIFDTPFTRSVLGNNITIESIGFGDLTETSIDDVCAQAITIHSIEATTSANEPAILETSLVDVSGKEFASLSDFYVSPLSNIFNNGQSAFESIEQDINGALAMQLYYNLELNDTTILNGIGFVIRNANDSVTIALREFNPVLEGNNLVFNFEPGFTLFNAKQTDANLENINIYLDALTQGNKTYVFEINENVYEFYNPCTGWSFVFINARQ